MSVGGSVGMGESVGVGGRVGVGGSVGVGRSVGVRFAAQTTGHGWSVANMYPRRVFVGAIGRLSTPRGAGGARGKQPHMP